MLLAVNIYIVQDLFGVEYTQHMGSPEGAFMAIARGWLEQPRDMLWWPYTDAGMPLQHSYFALVPGLTAALAKVAGWPPAHAFHAVSALAFCLGPVALFIMAWRMTGAVGASLGAALAYSLCSPSIVFRRVLIDLGDPQASRRLQNLVFYGEAPHILSLALLPIAVLLLYRALQGRGWSAVWLAGLVAAANAFGAVTLGIAAVCLLLAMETGAAWKGLGKVLVIGALAYLWISPLIPPSLIGTIARNSPATLGDFRSTTGSLIATAAIALILLLARTAAFQLGGPLILRVSALMTAALGGIVAVFMQFGAAVLPQPHRYHLGFELAACIFAAFGIQQAIGKAGRWLKAGVVTLLVAAATVQLVHLRNYARQMIQPIDIESRVEYRIARWLNQHLPGARVMAPGSTGFWLNVFADNPQLSNGHEPSAPNWMQRIAVYTIQSGQNAGAADGEISVKWLRLFGVQAIVVAGPSSQEIYHAIADPTKFEGLLPVLWREGEDSIYAVPQRSKSLVYAIPESAIVSRAPIHGLDVEPLEPALAALDDPSLPIPDTVWDTRHSAAIHANLRSGQAIWVQMNYHPGWRAAVNGRPARVHPDAAGLTVIEPDCTGNCEIRLRFGPGLELVLAIAASVLVMAGALVYRSLRHVTSGYFPRL
jgi:hypothetical protein